MVALTIKGFFLDQDKMPIVVLYDPSGQRMLPIWIGPAEASAIIVELQEIKTPSPSTHDLLAGHFQRHGFRMDRLEIYGRRDAHLYAARIIYHRLWMRYILEVRPSDGLAMAVRLKAPILATEELLAAAHFPALLHFLGDASKGVLFLNASQKVSASADRQPFN